MKTKLNFNIDFSSVIWDRPDGRSYNIQQCFKIEIYNNGDMAWIQLNSDKI